MALAEKSEARIQIPLVDLLDVVKCRPEEARKLTGQDVLNVARIELRAVVKSRALTQVKNPREVVVRDGPPVEDGRNAACHPFRG